MRQIQILLSSLGFGFHDTIAVDGSVHNIIIVQMNIRWFWPEQKPCYGLPKNQTADGWKCRNEEDDESIVKLYVRTNKSYVFKYLILNVYETLHGAIFGLIYLV